MIQEQIYKKDIQRPINGVIKADSKMSSAMKSPEYVITAEQQQPNYFQHYSEHWYHQPTNLLLYGYQVTSKW